MRFGCPPLVIDRREAWHIGTFIGVQRGKVRCGGSGLGVGVGGWGLGVDV